ncbi:hypothetical protein [Embleya sp. NPDC005971]|uniref:hypothetical protein n=1 Tax=Embleya sp. NPDC005971 TaxID=3156724 RepID=UPI0033C0209A
MTDTVRRPVPGPEPTWQPAPSVPRHDGPNNPARQYGMWDLVFALHRRIAILDVPLRPLADRLRLHLEESWVEPGPVRGAVFTIDGTRFAFDDLGNGPEHGRMAVYFDPAGERNAARALGLLLEVLGIGPEYIAEWRNPHGVFENTTEVPWPGPDREDPWVTRRRPRSERAAEAEPSEPTRGFTGTLTVTFHDPTDEPPEDRSASIG